MMTTMTTTMSTTIAQTHTHTHGEERFEDHRQNVLRHLDLYAQDVESLTRDLDSTLLASGDGPELGTAMCGDSPSPTKTPAAAVAAVARPSKAATRGGGR